jgi:putative ABC transport system permease protein
MPDRRTIYSWLLKLYPAGFREEYQSPMERDFQDEYRDAASTGARFLVWLRAIADVVMSAPIEMLRELRQDLEHAFRVYRRRPGGSIMAVLALALAIGAGTGVFSVLNALLLRSLPFTNPRQLVELRNSPFGPMRGRAAFADWRSKNAYLQDAAAFSLDDANLMDGRNAVRIRVAATSSNFFQLLGTTPFIGRAYSSGEDEPGRNRVAVISHSLWQQSYGGSSRAIGALLHIDGAPLTIIGVAPPRFDFPGATSVWTPTAFDFETTPKRGALLFQNIGRLKPGVSFDLAGQMFNASVQRQAPGLLTGDVRNRAQLISLQDQLSGPVRRASWVLAGMIFLVLLTACANVAQLLLSRTTERTQELAVRAALGASRARLVQQLITEATALTATAAALGLIVAYWTCSLASSIAPPTLATQSYTLLDWRVLAFAAALALLIGIAFGVIPAMLVGRLQPSGEVLRAQSTAGTHRARSVLVTVQAALTLILLASSITMGRTFLQLLHSDLGFQTAHVVTLNVSLEGTKYKGAPEEWRYYSAALDRLRSVSGVEAAGAVSYLPMATNAYMAFAFQLDSGQTVKPVVVNAIMPGYFQAMGTPFLAGHDLGHSGIIVNKAFAESAGLGTAILGRKVKAPWSSSPYQIMGVVETARYPGSPQIYWPVEEEPPAALTLVARVSGQAEDYLARCRDAVRAVDAEVPTYDVLTLDQRLNVLLARPRFYTAATLFLAALALLLAAVGIYGMAANSVAQRTREMGVRMALGASYQRIRSMLVRENAVPIACGLAAGIGGAMVSDPFLEQLLEGAQPTQPEVFLLAAGAMLCIGLSAVWIASARVLSIQPAIAVRAE